MKMTNEQAYNSLVVLSGAKETGLLGFAIARNRRRLLDELREYIDVRESLLKKYGEQHGTDFHMQKEHADEFFRELSEYGRMTFDFSPLTVDEQTFYSGSLNSEEMFQLDWMVIDLV